MADLLPNFQEDLIPQDAFYQQDRNSPKTTEYLSQLGAASAATFANAGFPRDPAQVAAMVETKQGEENLRVSFASEAALENKRFFDAVLEDRIIAGAGPEEIERLLGGTGPVDVAASSKSILERRGAQFLVSQGMANNVRAAAVLDEEAASNGIDFTKTDKREELLSTMLRLNTIKQKLADKWEGSNFAEKALDFATMALIPGHTSLTQTKVFGRSGGFLGASITEFVQNFWAAPVQKRLEILDEFENNLGNNTVVSQNLLAAMHQVEQLVTYKPEDEWIENTTEGLDLTLFLASIPRAFRAVKTISNAAKMAGAPDVAVGRALELDQQLRKSDLVDEAKGDELMSAVLPSEVIPEEVTFHGNIDHPGGMPASMLPNYSKLEKVDDGVVNSITFEGAKVDKTDEIVGNLDHPGLPESYLPTFGFVEKPTGPVNEALTSINIAHEGDKIISMSMEKAKDALQGAQKPVGEDMTPVRLLETLHNTPVPEVLNATEQSKANKAAIKRLMEDHNVPVDSKVIIDPETYTAGKLSPNDLPAYDVSIDQINRVRTVNVYLGTGENRMKGFATEAAAEMGAVRMGLQKGFYTLSEQSGQYYIKVSRNPGTTEFIELFDPKRELNETWSAFARIFAGGASVNTADFLKGANLSTKMASKLANNVMVEVNKINTLGPDSRKIYSNLMLDIQQKEKWKTMEQVRDWYVDNYQRVPSQKEVNAYKATRQLYEFDYVIRNAKVKNELVAHGFQEIKIKGLQKGASIGKIVETTSVDPNLVRIFDHDSSAFKIFQTREELGRFMSRGGEADTKVLVKMLQPTKNLGEYVITSPANVNTKALRAEVLNKVDGPHRIYDGDHFIKQQRIVMVRGKEVVENPRTHFAIRGQKEANQFALDYNEALASYQQAVKSGSLNDKLKATQVISEKTRYADFDEFAKAVEDGKIELSPFEVTKDREFPTYRTDELRNSSAIDPDFGNFSDDLKTMIENQRMFYSQRGERLPHPKEGLAGLMHPDEILSQAVGNVINTQAYNNFKMRQIDRWVKTYDRYLDVEPGRPSIEKFMNADFIGDHSTLGPGKKRPDMTTMGAAEAQRASIKRLINAETPLERHYKAFQTQIVDMVDNRRGADAADRVANIMSKNPVAAGRGFAFHAYLGMGDISQAIVQLAQLPGLVAISPVHASRSVSSLPMIRAALLNPKLDAHWAKVNEKLTMGTVKAAEFQQLVKDIRASGVDIVDANIGELDNLANTATVKGMTSTYAGKLFNGAALFFNEAEKANKVIGFSTAWMENYAKTGKGLMTPDEFATVGVRGTSLSGNMDRTGKAWWQTGLMSIPTQFWGQPFRVAEQLIPFSSTAQMGFKKGDKVRMYMGLALAYGPMLGYGGGAAAEYIKEKYREATGTEASDSYVRTVTSGIVGALLPETDISRLQPFGSEFALADFFDADKGINISSAIGASGSLGNRFYDATLGSAKLWAFLNGELNKEDWWPTMMDIAHDMNKVISSYNRWDKGIKAYQMKKYYTNKGDILQEDLEAFDAAMTVLGFPPLQSVEAFEANADLQDWTKTAVKDARVIANHIRDAMQSEDGSSDQRRKFAYAQYYINLYKRNDNTVGQMDFLVKQVDKNLQNMGAYNQVVFERLMKILGRTDRDLVRNKNG